MVAVAVELVLRLSPGQGPLSGHVAWAWRGREAGIVAAGQCERMSLREQLW